MKPWDRRRWKWRERRREGGGRFAPRWCHNFVTLQRHPGALPFLQSVDKQVWRDHCCILNVIDIGVKGEGDGGGKSGDQDYFCNTHIPKQKAAN